MGIIRRKNNMIAAEYSIPALVAKKCSPFPVERFANARILVVDDLSLNVKLIHVALEAAGYSHIASAYNGMEALEKTHHFQPDLVLLDIMMPVLNGYEYCKKIRSDPAARRMPIIVQTALGEREDKLHALSCGADDFINKPIDREELILRVHVHLERYFMFKDTDDMRDYPKTVPQNLMH
jgi:DNA-binding response OmpR family regulator